MIPYFPNCEKSDSQANSVPISFPEHARSQAKRGRSSGEIELIHVGFPM